MQREERTSGLVSGRCREVSSVHTLCFLSDLYRCVYGAILEMFLYPMKGTGAIFLTFSYFEAVLDCAICIL